MTTRRDYAWFLIAMLGLAALSGCHRVRARTVPTFTAAAQTPSPESRPADSLRSAVRTALACTTVRMVPIATGVVEGSGCDRWTEVVAADERGMLWLPIPSVRERAAAEMHCALGVLSLSAPSARVREARGCDRTERYDLVCGGTVGECAWERAIAFVRESDVDVAVDEGAPYVASHAATSSAWVAPAEVVATPPAAAPTDPSVVVRARIEAARPSLRRCAWGHFAVRAAWTADGEVQYSLAAPLAGTSAETCVREGLGADRVYASEAGALDETIR